MFNKLIRQFQGGISSSVTNITNKLGNQDFSKSLDKDIDKDISTLETNLNDLLKVVLNNDCSYNYINGY